VELSAGTEFSGVNALIYYSPSLFKGMGLNYEMQLDMSGVLNICQMVACFWSLWATDQFGRRPLLLYGGLGMTVAQFIVAILVSQFSENWPAHQGGAWASVAMLFVYMLTYGGTWGPIPWSMPAEIFPSSLRAKGVSYATMSNWLNNFIIGLITPPLLQNTGYGTYLFFGVFCLLSLVWVWFFVPETSGKTLEEMDQVFHSNTGQSERESRARIETEIARSVWNSHAAKQQAA
jgi:MFS family permease